MKKRKGKNEEKVNMMKNEYQTFGSFLQAKRVEKRISLRKMAETFGISPVYLSDIEKGRRNPPEIEKLRQFSRILNLSDEEQTIMLDLAGKERNSLAPDLPEYILGHQYVATALRTARDLEADEEDWLRFVKELQDRKG